MHVQNYICKLMYSMFLCSCGLNCWPILFKFGTNIPTLDKRMTIIGNYIRQNGAGLPYGDFSKRCRTTYIFIFDHSPRRIPPTPLSSKSVISKRFMVWEVTFSNSLRTKLWGCGSFWVCSQTLRSRKGCLPYPDV